MKHYIAKAKLSYPCEADTLRYGIVFDGFTLTLTEKPLEKGEKLTKFYADASLVDLIKHVLDNKHLFLDYKYRDKEPNIVNFHIEWVEENVSGYEYTLQFHPKGA